MRKLPRALLEALVACLGQTGEDILGVDPLGVPVEEPGVPDPLSGAPGGVKRKAAESLFTSPAKKPAHGTAPGDGGTHRRAAGAIPCQLAKHRI